MNNSNVVYKGFNKRRYVKHLIEHGIKNSIYECVFCASEICDMCGIYLELISEEDYNIHAIDHYIGDKDSFYEGKKSYFEYYSKNEENLLTLIEIDPRPFCDVNLDDEDIVNGIMKNVFFIDSIIKNALDFYDKKFPEEKGE